MKNVVGYLRSAVKMGNSKIMEQKEDAIRKYCAEKGLKLLEVFKDDGVSGLTFNRTGWFELKDYLHRQKGGLEYIIVPDYNTISRDGSAALAELQLLRRKYGVEVKAISERLYEMEKLQFKRTAVLSNIKSRKNNPGH